MRTLIGVNDPQAIKKWAAATAVAINKGSYFGPRLVGEGRDANMPIQQLSDLSEGAGDEVVLDLLMPSNAEPIVKDQTLSGKETPLKYYVDRMRIDQMRTGVDLGSRMTKKRTLRNIRQDAKRIATDWWKRAMDELFFIYLSGARGTGGGFVWSADNEMFTVNALTAPDSMHQMYAKAATSKASLLTTDIMDLRLIDRAKVRCETMGGDGSNELSMIPVDVEGESHYICLMHVLQADALRTDTGPTGWLEIQKAAAAALGKSSPIFKGGLGMHNNVVLHAHRNIIRFSDYGAGANVPAARALFLGKQAAFVAYGDNESGTRLKWTEEQKDHENSVAIGVAGIVGVKKATYKSKDGNISRDFGVMALDTAVVDPQ